MPDSPAAPDDVPTRIAVLEEISRHTSVTLDRIDRRLETLDKRLDTHFRWLVVCIWPASSASSACWRTGFIGCDQRRRPGVVTRPAPVRASASRSRTTMVKRDQARHTDAALDRIGCM